MTPTTPTRPRRRDRRRIRHEATKQEILDTAWSIVRADGLAALSLRALAHAVDMEPQSLYTYFASKNALYDHMFADGNQELASRLAAAEIQTSPAARCGPSPGSSWTSPPRTRPATSSCSCAPSLDSSHHP